MYTYLIRIKSARIGAKAIPIQANNEEEGIKDFCERFAIKDKYLVSFVDNCSYNCGLLAELTYCEEGSLAITDELAQEMRQLNGERFDNEIIEIAKHNALSFWKEQPHLAEEFINVMRKEIQNIPVKSLSPLFSKELYASVLMRYILEDCWYQDFSIERVKDKEVAEKLKVNG